MTHTHHATHISKINFSTAARSYDQASSLQRIVGQRLLSYLPQTFQPKSILDLGSGTGTLSIKLSQRFSQAQILGLDLAEGMIKLARTKCADQPNISFTHKDFDQINTLNKAFDLVISNFALHWSKDLPTTLKAILSQLNPNGLFALSIPVENSFHEITACWSKLDNYTHKLNFPKVSSLLNCLSDQCTELVFKRVEYTKEYTSMHHLRDDLKQLGSANRQSNKRPGLLTKNQLQQLLSAYDEYRSPRGLFPTTYDVLLGVVRKS